MRIFNIFLYNSTLKCLKLQHIKFMYLLSSSFKVFYWLGSKASFFALLYGVQEVDASSCFGLKPIMYKHWLDIYKESGSQDFHSSRQRSFFSICK